MEYRPITAIKGQPLADFLLEFPLEHEGDALTIISTSQTSDKPEPATPSPWWTLNVDGAVNNEEEGARIVLISSERHHSCGSIHFDFKVINNDAKYKAPIAGLKLALEMKVENLNVFYNSMLVVY